MKRGKRPIPEGMLRKTEIARRLGVPYSSLNYWIMVGILKGQRFGGTVLYDIDDCKNVLRAFRRNGLDNHD